MPIQFSNRSESWWSKPEDKENPHAPAFKIRVLDGFMAGAIIDRNASLRREDIEGAAALYRETIRLGLCDWKNVLDRDGNEIPFRADMNGRPINSTLKILESDWLLVFGLASAITSRNTLFSGDEDGEKTLGNLTSPSN